VGGRLQNLWTWITNVIAWRQLDRFIGGRLVVSWFPLIVLWIAKSEIVAPTKEMLGSFALVLALRLLTESTLPGSPMFRLIFAGLPIIGGALIFSGTAQSELAAWAFYVLAGIGTMLVAITDWRSRV